MVRIFFNGNIGAILSAADMDQIDLQISRYDLVARTGDRIGEPRKCGTDEHRTAQHYGQNAGEQCSLGVFAVSYTQLDVYKRQGIGNAAHGIHAFA